MNSGPEVEPEAKSISPIGPEAAALLEDVARAALATARADGNDRSWPAGLRPYLRFKKVKPATVQAVLRVVEGDPEFRQRLAENGDEPSFGVAGWLWLTRPDDWVLRFDKLVDAHRQVDAARRLASDERGAARKLAAVQQACDEARTRVGELEVALAQRSAESEALAADRDSLARELDGTKGELSDALEERERAVRELKETESLLASKVAALRTATNKVSSLEAGIVARSANPAGFADSVAAPVTFDPAEIRRIAEAQAAVAQRLAAELADMAATLVDRVIPGDGAAPGGTGGTGGNSQLRRPKLPPGLLDSSLEAARFWCCQPDAAVLIDGYNVSMLAWPTATTADQRQRLERAVGECALRWGNDVTIFWDGVDDGAGIRRHAASTLRVEFTATEVEADDAIIDRIEYLNRQLSAERLLVVVSTDARVRTGVKAFGAAAIRSDQFLEILSP